MTFNDDLVGLMVSYLDITEYNPDEQTTILSSFDVVDHDKVLAVWWKNSNVEVETRELYTMQMVNGKIHRTDGPALEHSSGAREWYVNGVQHRTDGPAVEWAGGTKEWYVNGKLHRTDGPAIEWANGYKEWYVNGELHRVGRPAREWANGYKEWWVDGSFIRSEMA